MRTVIWNGQDGELLRRPVSATGAQVSRDVAEILSAVREGGDQALRGLTQRFDGVPLAALAVSAAEIDAAEAVVHQDDFEALQRARRQLTVFHRAQAQPDLDLEVSPGVRCERRSVPIGRVGLYVPGGSAPLPSTVLMLGVPAELAGCPMRLLCTPPRPDGTIDPHILVAARLCGIEQIFKLGGAQAIAAMAYGSESVPLVDKLFGPGNAWVTQAKLSVAAQPGGPALDMPAGPSEVLVIGDGSADPAFVAADLLSQAEHGPDSHCVLVTPSTALIDAVTAELQHQLPTLQRWSIAEAALGQALAVQVADLTEALEFSNRYAPEHLILQVREPRDLAAGVLCAGSVFIGPWSPEAVGDYASGTNHVLPTYGAARAWSGLGLAAFQKTITLQELSREGLGDIGPVVQRLARLEGLDAHERAVGLRLQRDSRTQPESADTPPESVVEAQLELARPEIRALQAYQSARSLVPDGEARLFLDANEAPEPAVSEPAGLNRYPEPQPVALRQALAALYKVRPEQLLMTRGVDEGIDLLLRVFCRPTVDRILICPPTYGFYAITAAIQSVGVATVPYRREESTWQLDRDGIVRAVETSGEAVNGTAAGGAIKVVFLCSPNNPTGHSLHADDVTTLCSSLAGQAIVVLDEAYVEFSDMDSLVPMLARHTNLVVLRTLSKAWGLAGARFGATLAHPDLIALLSKVCPPYPLGLPTVSIVTQALLPEGKARVLHNVRSVLQERARLSAALAEIRGVAEVFESDANFLLVRVDELGGFMNRCAAAHVVVRDRSSQYGLHDCVRISVGSRAENQRLLAALETKD